MLTLSDILTLKSFSLCFGYFHVYHYELLFVPTSPHDSPEPHILLFRRQLGTDPQTGRVDAALAGAARDEYKSQFGLLRK